MTDAVQIALIVGVPATIAALGNIVIGVRQTRRADKQAVVANQAASIREEKLDDLATGQQEIHTLVNSNLTAVKADLLAAKTEILELKALVGRLMRAGVDDTAPSE